MIRVAVVDDQALVRAGFTALLDSDPEITVIAQAADGRAAIELVRQHELDVMLIDVRMPLMGGIQATTEIRQMGSAPQILILTTFDTDDNVFDALEAGAAGFLVKDVPPIQLLEAVKSAAIGGAVISPGTTRRLVDHLVAARGASQRPVPAVLDVLTQREREVLRHIAAGLSNREISARLHISELTTKTHVSRVLNKLGLESRVQAAVLAYETGLIRPAD